MFQKTKVPHMELLFPGMKVLGYESASYSTHRWKKFGHSLTQLLISDDVTRQLR